MKKLLAVLAGLTILSSVCAFAQEYKFGHVNSQEIIYLMDEMDSARVVIEKYGAELEEIFVSMQNEYQTKLNTYQQMNATWSPAVLQAKEQELSEIGQRLEQYRQNAEQDITQKQNEVLSPIYQKANDAIKKVGEENGFIYIFDTSVGAIPYFNEKMSTDVTVLMKKALNIPLDKQLPTQTMPQI